MFDSFGYILCGVQLITLLKWVLALFFPIKKRAGKMRKCLEASLRFSPIAYPALAYYGWVIRISWVGRVCSCDFRTDYELHCNDGDLVCEQPNYGHCILAIGNMLLGLVIIYVLFFLLQAITLYTTFFYSKRPSTSD